MANVSTSVRVEFMCKLNLNETEMRALDAIVGYGSQAFLKTFKAHMGEAYIRGHESGVESLFTAINRDVRPALREIADIRESIKKGSIPND